MRVLLTGSSGFLGRFLAARLVPEHEVLAVVRGGAAAPDGVAPIVWDLTTAVPLECLPDKVDVVLHAAQSRRYRDFPDGAGDVFSVNVAATAALLDYAYRAGATSFLLVSSGTVYEPYRGTLDENAPLAPLSLNGATKLAAETIALAYQNLFRVCALRLFFPYGPGQTDRLIPDIIRRITQGDPVVLSGAEGLRFAPVFATDVADVIAAAVTGRWSGRINLAGNEMVSLRELAQMIGRILGKEADFQEAGGSAPNIAADLTRLAGLYDIARFVPLEDGLSRTVRNASI